MTGVSRFGQTESAWTYAKDEGLTPQVGVLGLLALIHQGNGGRMELSGGEQLVEGSMSARGSLPTGASHPRLHLPAERQQNRGGLQAGPRGTARTQACDVRK
eukprot:6726883-Pyramimonas_sp.AAC.1